MDPMGALERLLVPRPDEAATLYLEHGEALRAFVLSRTRDPVATEDICQETFLAALARGVPGGGPEDAARWVFAIARNKVLKWHRDHEAARDPASGVARREDPAWALDDREERARVRAAVAALEPELREVILLRYEGELDYREVAARLGVPVSTVQGRLKRARHALRAALLDGRGDA
jgi:RNA polymerase sigma factor (sigma-70 family)